jgi:hypothetical protein
MYPFATSAPGFLPSSLNFKRGAPAVVGQRRGAFPLPRGNSFVRLLSFAAQAVDGPHIFVAKRLPRGVIANWMRM